MNSPRTAANGTDKAARSTFPLGINGNLSKTTKLDGTIAVGNLVARKPFRLSASKSENETGTRNADQIQLVRRLPGAPPPPPDAHRYIPR